MSKALPERASLEYLRTLAKDRLRRLRKNDPHAKLAAALLDVAREYGFSSWRALKTHIDGRQTKHVAEFVDACRTGDTERVRQLIAADSDLIHARDAHGSTALHAAAARGQVETVRLLLQHGADPNARDRGDNASPLHFAAGGGHAGTVRALLDAGADVHGHGDVHETDVIGWATVICAPESSWSEVLPLLAERGARHHIFSAIAVGDVDLIRRVVEDNPGALDRRMSRFEHGQTPLHFVINKQRLDILELLIELGANLEGRDLSGRTPLELAMMRGDTPVMQRLRAAGAIMPDTRSASDFTARMSSLAKSVTRGVPMIYVPDVARALDWYTSIGFTELGRFEDEGVVNFGMVSFGKAQLMLNVHGRPQQHDVSLWFYTDEVDALYQTLKARQIETVQRQLANSAVTEVPIPFEQDIEDMFYGARQFSIRDLNGYELYFIRARA
jgi:ankyrin repeat protein